MFGALCSKVDRCAITAHKLTIPRITCILGYGHEPVRFIWIKSHTYVNIVCSGTFIFCLSTLEPVYKHQRRWLKGWKCRPIGMQCLSRCYIRHVCLRDRSPRFGLATQREIPGTATLQAGTLRAIYVVLYSIYCPFIQTERSACSAKHTRHSGIFSGHSEWYTLQLAMPSRAGRPQNASLAGLFIVCNSRLVTLFVWSVMLVEKNNGHLTMSARSRT